jgi:Fur family ferric uptake transcriptional regulator
MCPSEYNAGMMKNSDLLLRQAKLRRTPVRVGVIDVLQAAKAPLSAADILAGLAPGTDIVTVYRTLTTFANKKIVHRVHGDDNVWLFALGDVEKSAQHRHPHFACESCGKVECLHESLLPARFLQSMGVAPSYTIRYSEVILHGQCPRCHARISK